MTGRIKERERERDMNREKIIDRLLGMDNRVRKLWLYITDVMNMTPRNKP